jgi:hypothetical protein
MTAIDSTRSIFLTAILQEENFQRHMNQILEDRILARGESSIITPRKPRKFKRVKRKTGKRSKTGVRGRNFWRNTNQLLAEYPADFV